MINLEFFLRFFGQSGPRGSISYHKFFLSLSYLLSYLFIFYLILSYKVKTFLTTRLLGVSGRFQCNSTRSLISPLAELLF